MYRTINKVLYLNKVLEEQIKSKESIYLKLKALLKTSAPGEYDVIRSWFFRSISISPEAKWFKILWIKCCILERKSCRSGRRSHGGHTFSFESIWLLNYKERWQMYYVRTVQPPSPLLCSLSQLPDKNNSSLVQPSLHPCSLSIEMDLKLILYRTIT